MRGHEEASGTKYIPTELFEFWKQLDPVTNYEGFLHFIGILSEENKRKYTGR
jgi:2-oxoisovalerate dehydrogenase E1 component